MDSEPRRVAWVTGGGGTIGSAVVFGLSSPEIVVVVADIDVGAADVVAQDIKNRDHPSMSIGLDVCDKSSVVNAAERILEIYSRIDLLVNCAGLSIRGRSEEVSEQDWDTVVNANLKGTFLCCQVAGRQMIKQGSGAIINIGSTAVAGGFPMRAAYCSAKAGVVALTQVLAVEWAPYNVRVNCVSPAHTRTPMVEDAIAKGFVSIPQLERRIPLGRLAEPTDIANVVAFLASDQARFITGINLFVDGGWTALGLF